MVLVTEELGQMVQVLILEEEEEVEELGMEAMVVNLAAVGEEQQLLPKLAAQAVPVNLLLPTPLPALLSPEPPRPQLAAPLPAAQA
jgi:ribosome biogenesis SPOUT family RNA methylase Rps3